MPKPINQTIAAAFALACAANASAAITSPGGFGESFLHFTNFQFRIGDLRAGLSPNGPLGTAGISGTETATASALLNGVADPVTPGCGVHGLGVNYSCIAEVGSGFAPLGPLTPRTADPLSPNGAGSGGLSSSAGDSRIGTAEVYLHSLSQLAGAGDTNASGVQDLFARFQISTTTTPNPLPVELSFNMERLLRAGLGQDGVTATASSVFTVTIKQNGQSIFEWAPNGNNGTDLDDCAVGTNCFSWSDPFTLNSNLFTDTTSDITSDANGGNVPFAGSTQNGFFEAEILLPAGFTYDVEIIGRVSSSAVVPEPGTLALLGLGMLGLGVAARKRFGA